MTVSLVLLVLLIFNGIWGSAKIKKNWNVQLEQALIGKEDGFIHKAKTAERNLCCCFLASAIPIHFLVLFV